MIALAPAAWLFAVMACSSFGADEPSSTPTTEAGVEGGPGPGTGDGGGGGADADAAPAADAAACARKVTRFGMGQLAEHEDGAGRVVLHNASRLSAIVGSDAGAATGQAYGSLDLGPNPSSITMSYTVLSRGIDGTYAEPGCAVDLFHSAADTDVTSVYFEHETNREIVFLIADAGDNALFSHSLGIAGTNLNASPVALALGSITATRLVGSLTMGATVVPFDVALPKPVVRARVYCGIYYAETGGAGNFPTDTQDLVGTACSD